MVSFKHILERGVFMFPFQVKIYSWHLNSLSWVRAKANCLSTSDLQMWVKTLHPPSFSNTHTHTPREELPPLSDCTTEAEYGPVRKSRHFQIYRWINWRRWERLTGHSSLWALAQWCARTELLCFDFLSWPPWQMSYRQGGGNAVSHHYKASPLSAHQFSHTRHCFQAPQGPWRWKW